MFTLPPTGATMPNSSMWARMALTSEVCWRLNSWLDDGVRYPGSTEQTFLQRFPDDFTYVLGLQEASVLRLAIAGEPLTRYEYDEWHVPLTTRLRRAPPRLCVDLPLLAVL